MLVVYMALGTDDRKDYASMIKALFAHYSITRSTYRQKVDQLRNVDCLWKKLQKSGGKVVRWM